MLNLSFFLVSISEMVNVVNSFYSNVVQHCI